MPQKFKPLTHDENCPCLGCAMYGTPPPPTRATADEAASGYPSDLTPETNHLAREWLSGRHKKLTIELARKAHQDWLSAPQWAREQVMIDEAARTEKEPPACWTLEPQGVDVEGLREAHEALPNTHKTWGNNGRLFGPICEQNGKEWVQVEGSFDPEPGAINDPEATAHARALCVVVNAIPALLDRVAELEQRLRIAADPDGAEREALRARVKELEGDVAGQKHAAEYWHGHHKSLFAQFAASNARITELERILSAERAEYDWAVKGAKALEAKVAAAKEWAENQEIQSRVAILTILNEGGTDGTV